MSWNYRIVFHDLDPNPDKHWYGLHEVYYDVADDPSKWTAQPITFICDADEGKDGIIAAMEMALKNLRDPRWGVVLKESDLEKTDARKD